MVNNRLHYIISQRGLFDNSTSIYDQAILIPDNNLTYRDYCCATTSWIVLQFVRKSRLLDHLQHTTFCLWKLLNSQISFRPTSTVVNTPKNTCPYIQCTNQVSESLYIGITLNIQLFNLTNRKLHLYISHR